MPTDYSHSNIEPIMLCHPSSLVADDKVLVNFYHSDQVSNVVGTGSQVGVSGGTWI